MLRRCVCFITWIVVPLWALEGIGYAQTAREDEVVNAIRTLSTIGRSDQERIANWVRGALTTLASEVRQEPDEAFRAFRERFQSQYEHPENTEAFRTQLVAQTAQIAADEFSKESLNAVVGRSLARVLVDMRRTGTIAGLVAGLRFDDRATRYLCAKGLTDQKTAIVADSNTLNQVVQAIREVGGDESDPIVLGQLYRALAFPTQVSTVFDVYLELFDKRLTQRRGAMVFVDRAEIDAFDFFRKNGVAGSLDTEQKAKLAQRLGVFLRLDAQRYAAQNHGFRELDALERRLFGAEECLSLLVGGGQGGNARRELSSGGHARRNAVLQEVYEWVGNPETKAPGVLNQAPWNVPIGAP